MKIPLNWLQQFISLTDISTRQLVEDISLAICEVENIISQSSFDVRVGEIKSIKKIEKSQKLLIAKVDVGNKQNISIIFGNYFEVKRGDRLPVAVAPTCLPTGLSISKKEIVGYTSDGMLVSDDELGLKLSDEGILRFSKKHKIGSNVLKLLGFQDTLDLKITPNRGDLLSIYGFARDLAAFYNKKINQVLIPALNYEQKNISRDLIIDLQAESVVNRYSAIKISGLKNINSPDWIQKRLLAAGFRPINAIVDITNYVMIELGQPLHAFDFEKISESNTDRGHISGSREIIVRRSKLNEHIHTLDDKKYLLPIGSVVIADHKKILALAGVIGSQNSSISLNTTQIVLESAIFDSILIRQTSKALNLITDSSQRFERKIDSELAVAALKRAVQLIIEICGGKITSELLDLKTKTKKIAEKITFSLNRFTKLSGIHISMNNAEKILRRLEFKILKKSKNNLEIVPPSWRHDILIEEDVFEEIERIYGFNLIPETLPNGQLSFKDPANNLKLENQIAELARNLGWNETLTFSFYSEPEVRISGIDKDKHLKLKNPLGPETSYLRASLMPGLLRTLERNINCPTDEISIFEIGRIFNHENSNFNEVLMLSGLRVSSHIDNNISQVRLLIDSILKIFNDEIGIKANDQKTADILVNDNKVGKITILQENILKSDRKQRKGIYFEITLEKLFQLTKKISKYIEQNPFPSLNRDVTYEIAEPLNLDQLIRPLSKKNMYLIRVALIDIFNLQNGRAVTLRLTYQAPDRTLTDEEVNNLHQDIIKSQITDGVKIKL